MDATHTVEVDVKDFSYTTSPDLALIIIMRIEYMYIRDIGPVA